MQGWRKNVIAAALLMGVAHQTSAQAQSRFSSHDFDTMTFSLGRHPSTPGCGRGCVDFIVAQGQIGPLSYFKLLFAIKRAGDRPIPVVLHSPGGLVEGGKEIANILKLQGYPVIIAKATPLGCEEGCTAHDKAFLIEPYRLEAKRAECASACAIAIAGASQITLPEGANIGVHRSSINPDILPITLGKEMIRQAEENVLESVAQFYASMSISPDIMDVIRATPNKKMRYLTVEELERFGFRIKAVAKPPSQREME